MKEEKQARKATHLNIPGGKEFDRLRKYVELIYLHGCFDTENLAKITHSSEKNYYATAALFWDLLWQDQDKHKNMERDNKKRYPYFPRSYTDSLQNRIADSYMWYSMNKKSEILLYLRLLQALRTGDAPKNELAAAVETLPYTDGELYQNTGNYIDKLMRYGYVTKSEKTYHLKENVLHSLSVEQLRELHTYVCFASGVSYPRVPGTFLRRTLERELLRRGETAPSSSPFILRNNSNHSVLDEEVVFRFLHLIEKQQGILLNDYQYIPVKLRADCRLGRWYVLMSEEYRGQQKPSMWVAAKLASPELVLGEKYPKWQEARAVAENAFGNSLFSGKRAKSEVCVEAVLHFGEGHALWDQFCQDIQVGGIEHRPDGTYYCAHTADPLVLVPLLRAYSPWLTVLPGSHNIDIRIRKSLQQMQDNLNGAPWDAPQDNQRTFHKTEGTAVPAPDPKAEETDEKKTIKPKPDETEASGRRLLNSFQSRTLQFCLELLAAVEGDIPQMDDVYQQLISKYGITCCWDIEQMLKAAGFLAPGDGLKKPSKGEKAPQLPMSLVEDEYLQYILDPTYMPEVTLFLSEETRAKLAKQPPSWVRHLELVSAPLTHPLSASSPDIFRRVLRAVQQRRRVRCDYRGGNSNAEYLPWKLQFNAYYRHWWVLLYRLDSQSIVKVPLKDITQIEILDIVRISDKDVHNAVEALLIPTPVRIRIQDKNNALRRCDTAFEDQQIHDSSYSPTEGYKRSFRIYRLEQEEVLHQLMHLGEYVRLDGPPELCEALRKRLAQAQKNNPPC